MSQPQPEEFDFNSIMKKEMAANAQLRSRIKWFIDTTNQNQEKFMAVVNEIREMHSTPKQAENPES